MAEVIVGSSRVALVRTRSFAELYTERTPMFPLVVDCAVMKIKLSFSVTLLPRLPTKSSISCGVRGPVVLVVVGKVPIERRYTDSASTCTCGVVELSRS